MLLDPRHRLVLRGVDEQPRAGLAEVLLGLPSLAQLGHGHLVQLHPGVQVGHRDPLIDYHVSAHGLKAGFQEASNVEQLHAEVRAAALLPDVPLLILSFTRVDPFKQVVSHGIPGALLREEIEAKFRLYTDFAGSVPRGEVRLVEAGHVTIHLRGEQAVRDAIADLLVSNQPPADGEEAAVAQVSVGPEETG